MYWIAKEFLPQSHRNNNSVEMETDDLDSFIEGSKKNSEPSQVQKRIDWFLENCPFVLPFKTRVKLFYNRINSEKQK